MPEISRFYGIVIRMFAESGSPHRAAHLHAYSGDDAAVYSIESGSRLAGSLTIRAERMVAAWIEIHREE